MKMIKVILAVNETRLRKNTEGGTTSSIEDLVEKRLLQTLPGEMWVNGPAEDISCEWTPEELKCKR